jgi:large subunit ribosomal protein L36e
VKKVQKLKASRKARELVKAKLAAAKPKKEATAVAKKDEPAKKVQKKKKATLNRPHKKIVKPKIHFTENALKRLSAKRARRLAKRKLLREGGKLPPKPTKEEKAAAIAAAAPAKVPASAAKAAEERTAKKEKPKQAEAPKKEEKKAVVVAKKKKVAPAVPKNLRPKHHKFSAIAVGLKRGYQVTKRVPPPRPARRKGVTSRRVKAVREIIREVCGFSPYEKRIMELLRNNLDKRALKFAKRRLGTHSRGKKKREELQGVIQRMRAAN